ncbi:MAG: peptidylprolyl isomerase [Verrucomicrobia bacterium]|nr:peptidylprolyl isomerase [Verrucomicrobiota bacterium]
MNSPASMGYPLYRFSVVSALLVALVFVGCTKSNTHVQLVTYLGVITIAVYEEDAPVTAGNFLRYVDEHRFEGAYFYRVVTMLNQPDNDVLIEVIQGGLGNDEAHTNRLPPIRHETTEGAASTSCFLNP